MVIASFLFFTALVAVITIIKTRKDDHSTSEGYFLAGRKLGGVVIAGSLLLTNLSTEQLVGLNGAAYNDGLAVMVWEVFAVLSLVAMALFFLPRWLRSGIATVPQFLEQRFDARTRTIADIIFLAAYAAILLPIILYTGATGLIEIIDVRSLIGTNDHTTALWVTVWGVGLIGSCYALFGGLRTVAVSDTLNGVGLLIGGLLITYFGLTAVSHTLGDGGGALDGWSTVKANAEPGKTLNSLGSTDTSVPVGTILTGVVLLHMFYWTTNQQIIQRTLGARSLAEGQKGVLLCGFLKLLGPLFLVVPGIIAWTLYARDPGLKGDHAYGRLVADVLPGPLTGFFAAVLVGAILSSFNSALNATCTLFSLGLYAKIINKDATEKDTVRSGKVFGWIMAGVAMGLAPWLAKTESIFQYLQTMNGIYFIPLLAVVVVGMLARRVPGKAATAALLTGLVVLLAGYFVPLGTKATDATRVVPIQDLTAELENESVSLVEEFTVQPVAVRTGPDAAPEPPAPIAYARVRETGTAPRFFAPDIMHQFHFLGATFVLLIAIMLAWGAVAPRPERWVHADAKAVDLTPWKGSVPAGIGLVLLVLAIYAVFADFSIFSA
ncbi:MAG: solute:sodium symporter family transporter [Phycisphaerales bacterium JB040]